MSSFKLNNVVSNISQSVTQLSNVVRGKGGDGKYFSSTRKGEVQELKDDLHSNSKERKKDAVKKIIAAMTLGKDVSSIFPDVVNCMQTANLELKKLVYLYVINYAKSRPEVAILAVNTFRKDAQDANPLIRALAIRTMGCIRLFEITEYLVQPLQRACRDPDPYVRKTGALCVCKLYETSRETVEEQGFIETLRTMMTSDGSAAVVANAVAALADISAESGVDHLQLDAPTVHKLLTALPEASEWGQVFILDALAKYRPPDSANAVSVVDRVTARLSHVNPAVVLSTIRLILILLERAEEVAFVEATHKKLGPPLITLLSAESEIQYVALRAISLLVQRFPGLLANNIKVFYCKFNDAHYVKMEKLEILLRLVEKSNVDQVLQELREYASEVDVEFVRRAIRAIGRCAIKLECAAEPAVALLLALLETKVSYVVQEALVVIKDIFRRYPGRHDAIIARVCGNAEALEDPEAKAAVIWIVGEHADRVDNVAEFLNAFADSFHDESNVVRLQLLTAAVKVFLKRPQTGQTLVTRVLKLCTEECDEPDVRDRAFIYWRLLSSDPEKARKVVLARMPLIGEPSFALDPPLLDKLIENLCSVSAVFNRLPESFVFNLRSASLAHEKTSTSGVTSVESIDEPRRRKAAARGGSGVVDLLSLEEDENSAVIGK